MSAISSHVPRETMTPIQQQLEKMCTEFYALWDLVEKKDTAAGLLTSDDEMEMRRIRNAMYNLSFDIH